MFFMKFIATIALLAIFTCLLGVMTMRNELLQKILKVAILTEFVVIFTATIFAIWST